MTDRPSRQAIPRGMIGAIALMIVVEAFFQSRDGADFSTVWAAGWRDSRRRADTAADSDVLCMGDSLVKFAVFPKVLEEKLGPRVVNLANCVGQPPTAYFLLKRALASGARPQAIVVDFTEHLLHPGPMRNVRLWPELLNLSECAELALAARDPTLFARLSLAKLFPSVKDRDEIRSSVLAAFEGKRNLDCLVLGSFEQTWRENRGAQPMASSPPKAHYRDWYAAVYPKRWHCHPANINYIKRFLTLADEHTLPVYWLLPPYQTPFQALCESEGVDGRFEKLVRYFVSKHRNLTVLDGRKAAYPDALYGGDPIHLGQEAAAVFSRDVADLVARRSMALDRPARWIELPRYRPRPAEESDGQAPALAGDPTSSTHRE
jgi:hypothetical protein